MLDNLRFLTRHTEQKLAIILRQQATSYGIAPLYSPGFEELEESRDYHTHPLQERKSVRRLPAAMSSNAQCRAFHIQLQQRDIVLIQEC